MGIFCTFVRQIYSKKKEKEQKILGIQEELSPTNEKYANNHHKNVSYFVLYGKSEGLHVVVC